MENEQEFLTEENVYAIKKWSEFVRINLLNGKSVDEIKERLRENRLSEKDIELLFDSKKRVRFTKKQYDAKFKFLILGLFKFITGFLCVYWAYPGSLYFVLGVLLVVTGIYWLVRSRTGEV